MSDTLPTPITVCPGFDADCAHGDPITEGETVILVHGVWFHLDCYSNGRNES